MRAEQIFDYYVPKQTVGMLKAHMGFFEGEITLGNARLIRGTEDAVSILVIAP
jgi:hypothetical protein